MFSCFVHQDLTFRIERQKAERKEPVREYLATERNRFLKSSGHGQGLTSMSPARPLGPIVRALDLENLGLGCHRAFFRTDRRIVQLLRSRFGWRQLQREPQNRIRLLPKTSIGDCKSRRSTKHLCPGPCSNHLSLPLSFDPDVACSTGSLSSPTGGSSSAFPSAKAFATMSSRRVAVSLAISNLS